MVRWLVSSSFPVHVAEQASTRARTGLRRLIDDLSRFRAPSVACPDGASQRFKCFLFMQGLSYLLPIASEDILLWCTSTGSLSFELCARFASLTLQVGDR